MKVLFQGLVEDVGKILSIQLGPLEEEPAKPVSRVLQISAPRILESLKPREEISVNGVCLTIQECTEQCFSVQIWTATELKTMLGDLQVGDRVNLERNRVP